MRWRRPALTAAMAVIPLVAPGLAGSCGRSGGPNAPDAPDAQGDPGGRRSAGAGPGAARSSSADPGGAESAPKRSPDLDDYVPAVLRWRAQREAFFRTDPQSPVPAERRASFPRPEYYPIDPSWRLTLPVLEDPTPQKLPAVTSTGEKRVLVRHGRVEFVRDGARVVLHLYREEGESAGAGSSFWVPFVDAGAGLGETYPAGRYLDAERLPDGSLLLDFNLAYNPYCAYGLDYSCPITPRENRVPIAIRAGERGFHRSF